MATLQVLLGADEPPCLCASVLPLYHTDPTPQTPVCAPALALVWLPGNDVPTLTTPIPCRTLAFYYCLQGNKIFCLCCFFSLAHL